MILLVYFIPSLSRFISCCKTSAHSLSYVLVPLWRRNATPSSPRVRAATTATSDITNKLDTGFLLREILDLTSANEWVACVLSHDSLFARYRKQSGSVYQYVVPPPRSLPWLLHRAAIRP